ncbi:hypothetical protein E2C01_091373 [Portunus trituberculatus]|uniref:NAD-dependent epimerase/dehydratase domain-containing protein n=1 Tax=Portunus trituberculatus TaxID=210409 RepID=A0A5B7JDT1_PORTR|nr:hypothetical protein [Portunus trituberculatus]
MCNPPCCVLVTGASGLLGRAVCGVLREAGHAVKGLAFSRFTSHSKSLSGKKWLWRVICHSHTAQHYTSSPPKDISNILETQIAN